MKCLRCGADAAGKFCAECGTPLHGAGCLKCGAELLPAANYCTNCGTRLREPIAWTRWAAAAAVMLALGAVGVTLVTRSAPVTAPTAAAPPNAPGQPGTPPPLTGSMREQADRLFNRIMQTREQGDTAGARFFLPMAITAYQNAGELDADGLYHLSVLQSLAGATAEALQSAQRILAESPNHLLGLHAAAVAARTANDHDQAREHYGRLLRVYEGERGKPLPEYQDHAQLIDRLRDEAATYTRPR